jgi:hypothetical protein
MLHFKQQSKLYKNMEDRQMKVALNNGVYSYSGKMEEVCINLGSIQDCAMVVSTCIPSWV